MGGRKLEAERQGAERQDEERATGAERPEVDATRRARRIRLGRSNLPLLQCAAQKASWEELEALKAPVYTRKGSGF